LDQPIEVEIQSSSILGLLLAHPSFQGQSPTGNNGSPHPARIQPASSPHGRNKFNRMLVRVFVAVEVFKEEALFYM
jgi:hypothetical protein